MQRYIDVKGMTRLASSMLGTSVEGNLFDWAKTFNCCMPEFYFLQSKALVVLFHV